MRYRRSDFIYGRNAPPGSLHTLNGLAMRHRRQLRISRVAGARLLSAFTGPIFITAAFSHKVNFIDISIINYEILMKNT